jgi:hypothetical protein
VLTALHKLQLAESAEALRLGVHPETYVHASDDDLHQGRSALTKIHKIA